MHESKSSAGDPTEAPAKPAPAARPSALSELVAGAGILSLTAGAWQYHPGAGLIVLGLALILIGVHGGAARG
jgi:hypothetical protein